VKPVYSIVSGGYSGNKALLITPLSNAKAVMSMPIAVDPGKTYTASYYVRGDKSGSFIGFGIIGAGREYQEENGANSLEKHDKLNASGVWERKTYTFSPGARGICLYFYAYDPVKIDAIQVEEGTEATEFVAPPIEGLFLCSEPNYAVEVGQPIGAKLQIYGKSDSRGSVTVTVRDFFRRDVLNLTKNYALDAKGTTSLDLPFDGALPGKGIYIIKAEYHPDGGEPRTDYYRLSILKSLNGGNPTSSFFGNIINHGITKGEDLARLYVRWGWGYDTCYGARQEDVKFLDKYKMAHGPALITYNYAGFGHINDKALAKKFREVCLGDTPTPDGAKFLEDTVCNVVRANPWCQSWALSTEIEGESELTRSREFDKFAVVQMAFWKGVKRANPKAVVYPDGGTSGFSSSRGIVEMTGYLAATQGKIKWDAIAVHPYGNLDGVNGPFYAANDMDVEIGNLVAVMKKYGYGPETPIDIDECFDITPTNLPEWGDDGCNDHYSAGYPSYDSGWKEFIEADWMARTYIMLMKYWPQLRRANVWSPGFVIVDQYLTPGSECMVPNTLGHLFPNPKFKADIRPAAGIRGYAFEDVSGSNCTVAIWCAMDKVDTGFERGPEIGVRFNELKPEVIDLMGNPCQLSAARNGVTPLQLCSAPLFLRVNKTQGDKLVQVLAKAQIANTVSPLHVSFKPMLGGKVEAKLENLTGNTQTGKLLLKEGVVPFEVPPTASIAKELPVKLNAAPGVIVPWAQTVGVEFADGKRDSIKWDMSSFTVRHAIKPLPLDPDEKAWAAIPAIPVSNWLAKDSKNPPIHGYPGKLDAKFQLAWDKSNLYVRVTCKNDKFITLPQDKWDSKALYRNDGSVELYLDTVASGRSNLTTGYDQNDYRYDFAPFDGSAVSGTGSVYRYHEVNVQLAGGMAMPTKAQAAKGVKCMYRRTGNTYSYVMILPQMYIEPLHLEKGWRAGFCLFIHDKDEGEKNDPLSSSKGVSISTRKGASPNALPDTWPVMVLGD